MYKMFFLYDQVALLHRKSKLFTKTFLAVQLACLKGPLFLNFCSFQTAVGLSGIETQIIRVEGERADHLPQ